MIIRLLFFIFLIFFVKLIINCFKWLFCFFYIVIKGNNGECLVLRLNDKFDIINVNKV